MKIPLDIQDVRDFEIVAHKYTGGGFSFKYSNGEMWISSDIPELNNWKDLTEYTELKRNQRLQLKYEKELGKLIWGEVKKDKDGDLTPEDLAEVDKKLEKL